MRQAEITLAAGQRSYTKRFARYILLSHDMWA